MNELKKFMSSADPVIQINLYTSTFYLKKLSQAMDFKTG